MHIRAILFDLDDTLLVNPMDTFIPAYLAALTRFMADRLDPDRLTGSLLRAIRVMDRDTDWNRTNAEVFFDAFLPPLGGCREELEPAFDRFYTEAFSSLSTITSPNPDGPPAVEWARRTGRQVVVATNPMFPASAIRQRLEWAGLPPEEVGFDLVTTLENSHSTKAHPEYYSEIARRLGRTPDECVMVGDNWRWDVVHAVRAGMSAFWIAEPSEPRPDPAVPVLGQGTLGDFLALARSRWGD